MMQRFLFSLIFALAAIICVADRVAAQPVDAAFFTKQIRPILSEHCWECHGGKAEKVKGRLWLRSREGLLRGGEVGAVIDLKSPAESMLLKAISYELPKFEMPPNKKLSDEQIALLRKWIEGGAPWDEDQVAAPASIYEKHESGKIGKDWWAYQPRKRPEVPEVQNNKWVTNPIDAFILAKLEASGLQPNPPADKVALVRRAYYDLIGLPPTPQQIQEFVQDNAPDAFERLVDQLLQSEHYGERWGRHWLDLVRFAETNGYERDGPKPEVWKYRDYVVRAFNEDKPYDRFIREQLAGDELPDRTVDSIIATGYYRLGVWDDEPADPLQARFDEFDDMVSTTGQVFLGMTINCARCHDHKIDPIKQSDYYSFIAFFRGVEPYSKTRDVSSPFNLTDVAAMFRSAEEQAGIDALYERREQVQREMRKLEDATILLMPDIEQRAAEGVDRPHVIGKLDQYFIETHRREYQILKDELPVLQQQIDAIPKTLVLSVNRSNPNPPQTHVMIRGNPHAEGAPVDPAFPSVFGLPTPSIPAPSQGAKSDGRRTVLADWIASPDNPMTARVMVNRIWQHHFGRGIVASSSEYGGLGTLPTHPLLLDWLASEFVARDWSIKAMHKLIMLSSAYRMSSSASESGLAKDPANELFWRFDMRRLTAEELRDSILAVNGTLNPQVGGPSIFTIVPQEILQTASQPNNAWGRSTPDQQVRRSIYIYRKRSLVEPILETFDVADTDATCPVRFTTTVPTQSLTMLNSEFFMNQAKALAARLHKEIGPDGTPAEFAARGLQLVTGRQPTNNEVAHCLELMRQWMEIDGVAEQDASEYLCLLMLNLNEFIYLD